MVLERAREQILDRHRRDLVNGMHFTYHRPERSTNVPALVEGARSVIVGARSYDLGAPPSGAGHEHPTARVARYAWVDHYGDLKASLTAVAGRLRRDGHRAVVFADDNSIVDRETAWLAGIGWFGKNANILVPGRGSLFVLGCVVTTADLPVADVVQDGCGTCSRCMPACPTGAIVAPGVIDGRRCLSWLLQKPGIFERAHRAALGDRIYGCDECQTSCPVNLKGTSLNRWTTDRTGGESEVVDDRPRTHPGLEAMASVDVLTLLDMDDTALEAVTDRWYVHQRDMTWVRRNLLIILGNTGKPSHGPTTATLARYASHDDPVLVAHALWSAARLGLAGIVEAVRTGPHRTDSRVAEELADLPALREDL